MARDDYRSLRVDYFAVPKKRGRHNMGFQAVTRHARKVFRKFSADKEGFFETRTEAEACAVFDYLDEKGLEDFTF